MREEVVVVGAGPAGIAAAVQLKRSGHDPLVIESGVPGGLLRTAWRVENYPGFPNGIAGNELSETIANGLEEWDVRLERTEVNRIDLSENGFTIRTAEDDLEAVRVILATGTEPLPFDCQGLDELPKDRVHRDIIGLREVTDSTFVIIGGGDAAFDYSLALAENGNRCVILYRSQGARCLPLLLDWVNEQVDVEVHGSTEVRRVAWINDRIAVRTEGLVVTDIFADHLIIAIGRRPRDGMLSDSVRSEMKRLTADGLLYVIGDVANGPFRQTAIAAGDGVKAAMEVHERLKECSE